MLQTTQPFEEVKPMNNSPTNKQPITFKHLRRNVIGWTQTRMAQEMGVTVRTIYRY